MAGNGTRHKTFEQRIWEKISPEPNSGCWLWTGCCSPLGYGQTFAGKRVVFAHRATYEHYIGKIPDGLVIDHLCRVPSCVNPDHLEPVTQGENVRRGLAGRKDNCRRGHPLTASNTYVRPNGTRACNQCLSISYKKPSNRERKRLYMVDYNRRTRATPRNPQCTG